ncbi:MAG: DUF1016 domain-containing protein [Candidatus Altiarchaeum hamiconexum]|uniref:DUF1016 domain-containing protein n=1 Tax=Candidatus Altarchaeum hamiconexum TaxID=1803513 RepID=A0A8J7YWY2_9ARCH|nr:DUF1016 domain-containing protein [Candidatus Altarchaeum hamiconexum]NCN68197.1 DUF1016 domain-containing protein [Candidatus Altarchaeum hamiconexum]NCS91761.1 DUF1016 domain-containing protein [Candidatus Altarchaeum hamiconexum]NCT00903.1 DUF1016 domain-containing protein [Candidatus Altarchaeum hamiconexum]
MKFSLYIDLLFYHRKLRCFIVIDLLNHRIIVEKI